MKPLVDRPTGGVQSGRSLLVRAVAGCVLDRGPLRRAAPGPMPGSRKRARSRARLAARRPGQGRIRPPERSALAKRFTFRLGLLGLRARRSDALLYSTEVQQRTRTTAHLDDHHRTVDQGELLPTKGRQVVLSVDQVEDAPRLAECAQRMPGIREVTVDGPRITARASDGPRSLPALVRAAEQAGVTVATSHVHRPTLDDVFLALTGRSLRDAAATDDTSAETQKEAA